VNIAPTGTKEIEPTPEQMAAGLAAYERERPGEASAWNEVGVVREVYLAMAALAAPRDRPNF
jgi:hypothetical protein